ncbi:MAG: pyrophosphatase [Paramuribaculum sp.]|nr:pyrophosphatase [Paramuribaculum sp.]MDE6304940.1 pyrophosphatase [Paramuribaculum sp.]
MTEYQPDKLTFNDFQHLVDEWILNTPAGYFPPLTNMAILAEETGEVARVMARRFGSQTPKPGDKATVENLAEELADVIRVCCAIANQTGINIAEALMAKHNLICNRDATRHLKK